MKLGLKIDGSLREGTAQDP